MHDDVVAGTGCAGDEVDLRVVGENGLGAEVETSLDQCLPGCCSDLGRLVGLFEFASGKTVGGDAR